MLAVDYFHVVFTLPPEVADLAAANPAVMYDLLFQAASSTLSAVAANPKHLGAAIPKHYTAETEWNGVVIAPNLTLDDSGTIDAALQAAHELWKKQTQWAERIEDFAVQELLPLKNES